MYGANEIFRRFYIGVVIVFGLATALAAWWGAKWAYLIEGRTLSIRRPEDKGWGTMQVDEIESVVELWQDDESRFEFVFRDGRRFYVQAFLFSALFSSTKGFRKALLAVSPAVRFEERKGRRCHGCGQPLANPFPRRCGACEAVVSRELPPIPKGGVLLPDAVER